MGKKSTWFSAIKRVFTFNSKDKLLNEADKTSWKEKKGGRGGRLKHGSFIPLFREPSSIEKILGEVDQQHLFIAHPQQQQLEQQQQQQLEQQQQQHEQEQQQQQQQQHEQQQQQQQHEQPQQQQLEQQQHEQQQQQHEQEQQQQQHEQQQKQKQQQQQQQQQQEQKQHQQQHQRQQQQQQPSSSSARPLSPISMPRITSPPPRPASTYPPRVVVHQPTEISHRPQPTLQQHISAISIQAAYRGHMARRKVRGLTGHVRLQGVVRGQNVKRQTVNAMKQMQLLVRVQTQIQSRRIQMLENQALKRQTNNNDKQVESSLGNNPSEMGDEHWDDSFITKEEREARLQKKVEAVIKRERAMAYAYSHKLGKATPTSAAQTSLMDIRTGGYPCWWNWLDRQLPSHSPQPLNNRQFTTSSFKPTPDHKLTHKQLDTPTTPMSSRSMAPSRTRSRTPPNRMMKYSKAAGGGGGSPYSMKDDDSLMSCPAFSVPNYMSPTISAKAKARPTSNPKDRVSPSTPGSETIKRRFSFPFTPDSNHRNRSPRSVGGMSINSAISVPASLGRKPFNRFV